MSDRMKLFGAVTMLTWWGMMNGCAGQDGIRAEVDREEAQASAGRLVSTEVAPTSIPHDPALPIWVVAVEPFVMGASGAAAGIGSPGEPHLLHPGGQIGSGVAAQLVSSLQRVGNVAVIDYATYARDPARIAAGLKKGEGGPYIIKGTVTEFSEIADASGKGESTGPNVPAMFIPYVGGLVSYGIGTKSASETRRIGMVGLDIQIVEPATGRLIASFTAEGEFTSLFATKSRTTWGNTKTSVESASSAIGQAQRIALNQTVTQIHATFKQSALIAGR